MNIASLFRVALAAALLSLCPLSSQGQWAEDFSGGTAALPTQWQGDLTHFQVDAGQLRLNAPAAGSSVLHTRLPYRDSMRWEFFLRLDFPPSATNAAGILLCGDTPDPATATGYLLEVGENGNADALRLFRLEQGKRHLLASGTPGSMAGNAPIARVRLDREAGGQWTLWADHGGGSAFSHAFSVLDAGPMPGDSAHFSLHCLYTATRTDKFFFDDLRVGPLLPDTKPPTLLSLEVIDSQEIRLLFDEDLNGSDAGDPELYRLLPDDSEPALAAWQTSAPREVRLVWAKPFKPFSIYELRCVGVEDIAGNRSDTLASTFTFLPIRTALSGELLLHEIMADPTPSAGLPAVEYLEIRNVGGAVLDLKGVRVTSGSASATLPGFLLWPDSLLLLVRPEHMTLFEAYGTVLGVPSLPALPNDGAQLQLLSAAGIVLHEVAYAPSWHATTVKADGGWSLEMVSPALRCLRNGNWESSTDPTGGTPGRPNSVFREALDLDGPRLLQVWPLSPDRLLMTFDERLETKPSSGVVALQPSVPVSDLVISASGYEAEAVLAQPLQPATVYRVNATPEDCLGNAAPLQEPLLVGLPEKPEPGDLLLNEILFDPPVGGSDFVELWNISEKVLALEGLLLANIRPGKEDTRPVDLRALCLPGEYVVLTADTAFLRDHWPSTSVRSLHEITLPAWPADSGDVSLFLREGTQLQLLDRMAYRKDMHYALLPGTKGVSLERIREDAPGGMAGSWHSAAADAGHATPTRRNSQYRDGPEVEEEPFTLVDPVFSPDGDGVRDVLLVHYRFPDAGQMLNMKVFDRQGRQVKDLARELFLGTDGVLTWSGDTGQGGAAGPGAYILWMETWRPEGQVRRYRKAAVLSLPTD